MIFLPGCLFGLVRTGPELLTHRSNHKRWPATIGLISRTQPTSPRIACQQQPTDVGQNHGEQRSRHSYLCQPT
jgi:hypothetical protein